MRKTLFLFFVLLSANMLSAQIVLEKQDFDLGEIKLLNDDVIDLNLKNNSPDRLFIVMIEADDRIQVKYTSRTFQPMEAQVLRLKLNPSELGKYKSSIKIFFGQNKEPIRLNFTAEVVALAVNHLQDCPDFSSNKEIFVNAGDFKRQPKGEIQSEFVGIFKEGELDDYLAEQRREEKIQREKLQELNQQEEVLLREKLREEEQIELQRQRELVAQTEAKEEDLLNEKLRQEELARIEAQEAFLEEQKLKQQLLEEKLSQIEQQRIEQENLELLQKNKERLQRQREELAAIQEVSLRLKARQEALEKQADKVVVDEFPVVKEEKPILVEETTTNEIAEETSKPVIEDEIAISKDEVEETEPVETIVMAEEENVAELFDNSYRANNIVFLLDASTSMQKEGKMELLKAAMKELLIPLREIDYIAIVSYAGDAEVLLASTPANNKPLIEQKIDAIVAEGSTAAGKGINKALQVASSNFIEGGNNQIILATDGAFDIGSKNTRLRSKIERHAKKDIHISVIGIKNDRWTNKSLKEIADLGQGNLLKLRSENNIDVILEEVKSKSYAGF